MAPSCAFVNAAYYPSWKVYRNCPPSNVNASILTHLFYAFARLTEDGQIVHLDNHADVHKDVDGMKGCIAACHMLKRQNPELKIILSIGGGSGSKQFAPLASNPESRKAFAYSTRQFLDKFQFDGVDIDWEHPANPEQGRDYLKLLQALRESLPTSEYIITSALPAGEWCLRNIDIQAVGGVLDYINLMCYDFSGPWTGLTGHLSQLYSPRKPHNAFAKRSCDSAVQYLLSRAVPSEKILLGVPCYGRSFLGATNIGQTFMGHAGEQGTFPSRDLPRPSSVEHFDEEVVAVYCEGPDGGFVTYDTPATVRVKASYAKTKCLGGLFYWTAVDDAVEESRSLLQAGFDVLNSH